MDAISSWRPGAGFTHGVFHAGSKRFFALYRRQDDAALITEALLRERLETTGDAVFPWRLPSLRPAGILVFDASNIPEMPQNRAEQEEKPE